MECNIHSLKTDDSEDLCTEALFLRISKKDKARAQMLSWLETKTVNAFLRSLINERWAKIDFSDPNIQTLIAAYERGTRKKTDPQKEG